jgi:hypothetical protein
MPAGERAPVAPARAAPATAGAPTELEGDAHASARVREASTAFDGGAGVSARGVRLTEADDLEAGDRAEPLPQPLPQPLPAPGPDLATLADAPRSDVAGLGQSARPSGHAAAGWGFDLEWSAGYAGGSQPPTAPDDGSIEGATPEDPEALEQLKETEPWVVPSSTGGLPDVMDLAEAVAAALERVARRVRAREVIVGPAHTPATDEEAVALALLALLSPPR